MLPRLYSYQCSNYKQLFPIRQERNGCAIRMLLAEGGEACQNRTSPKAAQLCIAALSLYISLRYRTATHGPRQAPDAKQP